MGDQTASTRQTVLELLKRWHELTTAELAVKLNITEMAVRRHLKGLEEDNLVSSRTIKQSMGRPVHKYFLTHQGTESFPRNYSQLSLGFLDDLRTLYGDQSIQQLFEKRHARLQQTYKIRVQGSLKERVEALARIQNEQGYMVEWTSQQDGSYRFVEYNCPIAQVAKSYPVACTCEKQLFKELLGTNQVERHACMAENGDAHCVYTINKDDEQK